MEKGHHSKSKEMHSRQMELQSLVHLCCYNRISETGKFIKNRNLFLIALKVRRFKSVAQIAWSACCMTKDTIR